LKPRRFGNRQFRDLFEFSPDATMVVDREGHIALANGRASLMFGYTRQELLSMSVEQLMPEPAARNHLGHRRHFFDSPISREMGAGRKNLQARRRDGALFSVDIALSPIDVGAQAHVLVAVRDVTDRVQVDEERLSMELRRHRYEKMEALGRLAGGITHDFNNLLSIISGHAELLLATIPKGDKSHHSVAAILQAGQRGAALTGQVLSFTRHHDREIRPVNLNAVIDDIHDMLRLLVDPSVAIVIVRGENLRRVRAVPEELGQVMMNLAKNASDAMRDGGVLTIATANAHINHASVEHPTLRSGKYVILRVSDTGVGMEAETSKRMFEPLFTTKGVGEGTGLGLSIVSEIVRHSGGTISATSTPGHGTEFTIHLPQCDASAPDAGGAGARPDESEGARADENEGARADESEGDVS
jgi:hypothetical protein